VLGAVVEPTIKAILSSARTGEVGDGKIFVQPLEQVIRIRTGERDNAALTPSPPMLCSGGRGASRLWRRRDESPRPRRNRQTCAESSLNVFPVLPNGFHLCRTTHPKEVEMLRRIPAVTRVSVPPSRAGPARRICLSITMLALSVDATAAPRRRTCKAPRLIAAVSFASRFGQAACNEH